MTGALGVANELLNARGGIHGLVRATTEDLALIGGIGLAKAAQLLAAVELGRRTLAHSPRARVQLRTPLQRRIPPSPDRVSRRPAARKRLRLTGLPGQWPLAKGGRA